MTESQTKELLMMQAHLIKAVQQNTESILRLTGAIDRLSSSVQDMVVTIASLPIEEDAGEPIELLPGEKSH